MNLLNRFVVVLALLLGIVFWIAVSVGVVFWPLLDKSFLRQVGEGLIQAPSIQLQPAFVVVFALLSIVVVVLLLVLLWLELVPSRPSSVTLPSASGGVAAIVPVQTVADRVRFEAEQVPGVAQARPVVHARRNAVDIEVKLVAPPGVGIQAISDQVGQAVRAAVEGQMGVPVNKLAVRVQLDGSSKVQRQAAAVRETGGVLPGDDRGPTSAP